jgi:hypothetical protein
VSSTSPQRMSAVARCADRRSTTAVGKTRPCAAVRARPSERSLQAGITVTHSRWPRSSSGTHDAHIAIRSHQGRERHRAATRHRAVSGCSRRSTRSNRQRPSWHRGRARRRQTRVGESEAQANSAQVGVLTSAPLASRGCVNPGRRRVARAGVQRLPPLRHNSRRRESGRANGTPRATRRFAARAARAIASPAA